MKVQEVTSEGDGENRENHTDYGDLERNSRSCPGAGRKGKLKLGSNVPNRGQRLRDFSRGMEEEQVREEKRGKRMGTIWTRGLLFHRIGRDALGGGGKRSRGKAQWKGQE